jgi:HPt (histidine-containing phosphotransfer) domain-containing protein
METSAAPHLSNVVNVWITIFKGGTPVKYAGGAGFAAEFGGRRLPMAAQFGGAMHFVEDSPAEDAGEPAIDLVHLARQTDGDTALEVELLALFDRQSGTLLTELSVEGPARRHRADVAHKLRGSALAIGAGRVASAAQTLETLLSSDCLGPRECERALDGLAAAVAEARAAIAELLG